MKKPNVIIRVIIIVFLFTRCVSGPVFSKSIEEAYQDALLEVYLA